MKVLAHESNPTVSIILLFIKPLEIIRCLNTSSIMRFVIVLSAVFGLAIAVPKPAPQVIDVAAVEAVPTPTVLGPKVEAFAGTNTYNPTVAASEAAAAIPSDPISKGSLNRGPHMKRDACAIEPKG